MYFNTLLWQLCMYICAMKIFITSIDFKVYKICPSLTDACKALGISKSAPARGLPYITIRGGKVFKIESMRMERTKRPGAGKGSKNKKAQILTLPTKID